MEDKEEKLLERALAAEALVWSLWKFLLELSGDNEEAMVITVKSRTDILLPEAIETFEKLIAVRKGEF